MAKTLDQRVNELKPGESIEISRTRSSARWGRDSLCPSGAAFVSTDSAAPSGLPEVGR